MATISKRGGGWFAQVRRKGFEPRYRTFPTKTEAEAWARATESAMDVRAAPVSIRDLKRTTLGDLLRRYIAERTVAKRGADVERLRLEKVIRAPVCRLSLADLTSASVAAYRDARLAEVSGATVRREIALIRHAIDTGRRDWGLCLTSNPARDISLPAPGAARDRRLRQGELERLTAALALTRNPHIRPAMLWAICTAMRRGELLAMRWDHIDVEQRLVAIPTTKTGVPRIIPLTDDALAVLAGIERVAEKVFPTTATALRLAWNRLRARAGLPDLHWHDLRHESISRFCEMGLTLPEVALVSGHRDPRMLFRYAHLRPATLAAKLTGMSWQA